MHSSQMGLAKVKRELRSAFKYEVEQLLEAQLGKVAHNLIAKKVGDDLAGELASHIRRARNEGYRY